MSETASDPNAPILARFYEPLDEAWVYDTYDELCRRKRSDADEFLASAARCDPFILASIMWPQRQFVEVHRRWVEHAIFNKFALVLGPRDHAKTTSITELLPPWALINDVNLRTATISASKDKALTFSVPLRDSFFDTDQTRHLFGDYKNPGQWYKSKFTLAGRDEAVRDPSVTAFGPGGAATSFHPDILFFDDIVDVEHAESPQLRQKTERWIDMTIEGALEPHTQVISTGTRYHPEDLYAKQMRDGYAVNAEDTRRCFLDGDEVPIPKMRKCLWPEKFEPDFFHQKFARMGEPNFRAQYFNESEALLGQIWRSSWFRSAGEEGFAGPVVIGVDTAYATRTHNDHSALVAVRQSENTGLLIVEAALDGHWGPLELLRRIKHMYNHFGARAVVIEDIGKSRGNKARENQFFLRDSLRMEGLPIDTVRPAVDKVTRYHEFAPMYQTGNVLHRPGSHALERQLLRVPNAEHDDLADALIIAMAYLKHRGKSLYSQGSGRNI